VNPIDAYVRELAGELRAPAWRRRRILIEVRAHLLEAAEAERAQTRDEPTAVARALERFGRAEQTAREFNRARRRRRALVRRTLVPWVAAAAVTSMASASVWAFEPGGGVRHSPRPTRAPALKAPPASPAHPTPPRPRAAHRHARGRRTR
jgi:hypothetical protein